jgi:2-polyprenyl-3-methyl-5-hydroxy-6-metoxy-1,4-benzoquinol methylase
MENRFEERYRTGDTPWDHGVPDHNLIHVVTSRKIEPCKALDIGCGTGDNVLWLAEQGFDVIGCDLSDTAIDSAKLKAAKAGVSCSFIISDFMEDLVPGSPFGFVMDRGCLHSVGDASERKSFAEKVSAHLEPGGLWLTLAGNADDAERETGPPRLTAEELVTGVEPFFEILSLAAGMFGSDEPDPPRAWICLMRKR